jgi:hypothetical protein
VQYKSLEPDGLAVARLQSTGDGSGGNVLHTFRGQQGFFYILRSVSAEMDEDGAANLDSDVEIRLDAQWLADRAGLSQGDLFTVLSMGIVTPAGGTLRRVPLPNFINGLLRYAEHLPLGRVGGVGLFDILSMSHRTNVLTNEYVSFVVFDVYRQEALTVPGVLNQLRQGLIR